VKFFFVLFCCSSVFFSLLAFFFFFFFDLDIVHKLLFTISLVKHPIHIQPWKES